MSPHPPSESQMCPGQHSSVVKAYAHFPVPEPLTHLGSLTLVYVGSHTSAYIKVSHFFGSSVYLMIRPVKRTLRVEESFLLPHSGLNLEGLTLPGCVTLGKSLKLCNSMHFRPSGDTDSTRSRAVMRVNGILPKKHCRWGWPTVSAAGCA